MLRRGAAARSVAAWSCDSVLRLCPAQRIRKKRIQRAPNHAALHRPYTTTSNGTVRPPSNDEHQEPSSSKDRKRWSLGEDRELVRLLKAGHGFRQISAELESRSAHAVKARLRVISHSGHELAAHAQELRHVRRKWVDRTLNDADREQVKQLRDQKTSWKKITENLGLQLHPSTVANQFRANQLRDRSGRRLFSTDEDSLIRRGVEDGLTWNAIAKQFPSRSITTLQQRWHKHLRPSEPSSLNTDEPTAARQGPWTIDERLRLLQLWQCGKTLGAMSRDLQRSRQVISWMLYSLNLSNRQTDGVGMEVLRQQKQRLLLRKRGASIRPQISQDDIDRIKAMLKDGMGSNAIAHALGRARSTALSWIFQLSTGRDLVSGRWSDQEVTKFKVLWDGGVPANEIAISLGRTPKSVGSKIHKLRKSGIICNQPRMANARAAE